MHRQTRERCPRVRDCACRSHRGRQRAVSSCPTASPKSLRPAQKIARHQCTPITTLRPPSRCECALHHVQGKVSCRPRLGRHRSRWHPSHECFENYINARHLNFCAQSRSLHSVFRGEFVCAARACLRSTFKVYWKRLAVCLAIGAGHARIWSAVWAVGAANGLAECARLDAHLVGPGAPPKPVRAAFCPRDHVGRTQHFVAASLAQCGASLSSI